MSYVTGDLLRALAYTLAAPVSLWLGFVFLNDRQRSLAYFFILNALMNMAWLASTALTAQGGGIRELQLAVVPVIVASTGCLISALVSRLRRNSHKVPPRNYVDNY